MKSNITKLFEKNKKIEINQDSANFHDTLFSFVKISRDNSTRKSIEINGRQKKELFDLNRKQSDVFLNKNDSSTNITLNNKLYTMDNEVANKFKTITFDNKTLKTIERQKIIKLNQTKNLINNEHNKQSTSMTFKYTNEFTNINETTVKTDKNKFKSRLSIISNNFKSKNKLEKKETINSSIFDNHVNQILKANSNKISLHDYIPNNGKIKFQHNQKEFNLNLEKIFEKKISSISRSSIKPVIYNDNNRNSFLSQNKKVNTNNQYYNFGDIIKKIQTKRSFINKLTEIQDPSNEKRVLYDNIVNKENKVVNINRLNSKVFASLNLLNRNFKKLETNNNSENVSDKNSNTNNNSLLALNKLNLPQNEHEHEQITRNENKLETIESIESNETITKSQESNTLNIGGHKVKKSLLKYDLNCKSKLVNIYKAVEENVKNYKTVSSDKLIRPNMIDKNLLFRKVESEFDFLNSKNLIGKYADNDYSSHGTSQINNTYKHLIPNIKEDSSVDKILSKIKNNPIEKEKFLITNEIKKDYNICHSDYNIYKFLNENVNNTNKFNNTKLNKIKGRKKSMNKNLKIDENTEKTYDELIDSVDLNKDICKNKQNENYLFKNSYSEIKRIYIEDQEINKFN